MGRILNSLIDDVNNQERLPKYLVVALDKDLINDIDNFDEETVWTIREITSWMVRQINMIV